MGVGRSMDSTYGYMVKDCHPDLGSDLHTRQHADRMVGLIAFEAFGQLPESRQLAQMQQLVNQTHVHGTL